MTGRFAKSKSISIYILPSHFEMWSRLVSNQQGLLPSHVQAASPGAAAPGSVLIPHPAHNHTVFCTRSPLTRAAPRKIPMVAEDGTHCPHMWHDHASAWSLTLLWQYY